MKKIKLFAIALVAMFSMSAMAASYLPLKTLELEKDTVVTADYFTALDRTNTDNWAFDENPGKKTDKQFNAVDSYVESSKTTLTLKGGALNPYTICSTGRTLHMRVTNAKSVSVYGVTTSDGRGFEIFATEISTFSGKTDEELSELALTFAKDTILTKKNSGVLTYDKLDSKKEYVISVRSEGTDSEVYLRAVRFVAGELSPSIKAVSIAGVDATISNDTIIAELPYGTTPDGALASVVVTYGGNGASYEINPLNGTVTVYNADKSQSKVYQLSITIAQNPSSEKELLDVKINGEEVELVNNAANLVVSSKTDISAVPVEFTLSAAATADFTSGNTHDFANPLVITVTAQDKSTATYTLTVTKAVKSILYIGGKTDDKVATAFAAQNWYVVARSAAKAPQTYEEYDVVVLHESIDGKLAGDTTSEVNTILEKNIPVLNTKTYFYNSGRWGIGTPAGGTAGETAIRLNSGEYGNVANHPLFTGVTTTEGTIEMVSQADGKAMQPVADYEDTWTKSILAKVSGGTVIEEALSGNYLLISIGSGSFQYLTEDALKVFVNAVNYLTSTEKFVLTAPEVKSDKKEITSFKLNGIAGVIDTENHTIAVSYPELLGDITAIEPLIVISEYATITPEGAQDFTKPVEYTVTAQDGTTQVWTVTVTVSQLGQLQKTDMDYASDMSTWENVPEWIFIKDGALNKAYAGNDYTGSAIRINKDGEVYFGLAVCSKITVTVSATGGRTFKLEVVGDDTKVVTKEGKSNTNYPLELVVNSESPVTVKLSTPGANGGATVQKVEVMYVEGGIGTALEDIQALDVNAPMYNVLGVEVDKAYKGIVIQNGKKYLLK